MVLVARLLDRLGIPIDRQIAENLYAGLATDTGHFRHADSAAHQLAARLIDAGVRPPDVMVPITDVASVRLARHAVRGAGQRRAGPGRRAAAAGWSTPSSTTQTRAACARRSSIR